MDPRRFDDLVRTLPGVSAPRRRLLLGLSAGLLAAPGWRTTTGKQKARKKQLQRNAFGCVDVGKACQGNNANCCSGICNGEKPKKGKRDTSRCAGHDASTCPSGLNPTFCGGTDVNCVTSALAPGACATTTGNAAFCFSSVRCLACKKDSDCTANCGAQAACVICADCASSGGTACAGIGNCV